MSTIHKITAENPPQFPAYLWSASANEWHRYLYTPTSVRECGWTSCGYSHWSNSPTAPTQRPDEKPIPTDVPREEFLENEAHGAEIAVAPIPPTGATPEDRIGGFRITPEGLKMNGPLPPTKDETAAYLAHERADLLSQLTAANAALEEARLARDLAESAERINLSDCESLRAQLLAAEKERDALKVHGVRVVQLENELRDAQNTISVRTDERDGFIACLKTAQAGLAAALTDAAKAREERDACHEGIAKLEKSLLLSWPSGEKMTGDQILSRSAAMLSAVRMDLDGVKGRFCAHHATPGAVGPGCPECERVSLRKSVAESPFLDVEKRTKEQIIETYKPEILRHAANAAWNKLNEAMSCFQTHPKQAAQCIWDARELADIIVHSPNAEAELAALRSAPATDAVQLLRDAIPFLEMALDVEAVGGPDEQCGVNRGHALLEQVRAYLSAHHLTAQAPAAQSDALHKAAEDHAHHTACELHVAAFKQPNALLQVPDTAKIIERSLLVFAKHSLGVSDDTARLDWLAKQQVEKRIKAVCGAVYIGMRGAPYEIRAAIDAARNAKPDAEPDAEQGEGKP